MAKRLRGFRITRRYISEDTFVIKAHTEKEALDLSGQWIGNYNTIIIGYTSVNAQQLKESK